ncbi:MAG: hypothetical protein MUC58_09695, partial [Rhizobiaceae bacterium]|nr:hypothetical protein [Rhizobiaceae bacterium]
HNRPRAAHAGSVTIARVPHTREVSQSPACRTRGAGPAHIVTLGAVPRKQRLEYVVHDDTGGTHGRQISTLVVAISKSR